MDLQTLVAPVEVALPEEIDISNAAAMREQLRSAFSPGVMIVIADLTATAFCDTSGCRNLLIAHDEAEACGAQLRVVVHADGVRRVLKLLGFDRLLDIYANLESARTGNSAV